MMQLYGINRIMTNRDIHYQIIQPNTELLAFVESFWMLQNVSASKHDIVILPDGRFDIIFSYSAGEPFRAVLRGLDTQPSEAIIAPEAVMFAVSFKLPAIEYLIHIKAATVLNEGYALPANFWDISESDLDNFQRFCEKISGKMMAQIKVGIDNRKQKLFELIYSSNGELPVKELSEKVFWSSRQINRYFNEQFGISLKAYCNILRFKASLQHIRQGKLYPEHDFTDQNHFIKEIKKFSGVVPKELYKNQNDRFILLSTLPVK